MKDLMLLGCVAAIILVVLAFLFMPYLGGISAEYSAGDRAGTITKFSHKGYVIKTYEGELVMGGISTDSNGHAVANVFEFSVVDTSVVTRIEKALESGRRVKLHYKQVWVRNAWSASTDYYVTGVETLDEKPEK